MVKEFISAASLAAPELDVYSIQNDGKCIHVYDAYVIRLLSEVFRVPYKVIVASDGGSLGRKLPDGNWTGMMGMIQRSEVDLALGLSTTHSRFQDVNFSYPYFFSDVTFMTDKLKHDPSSLALIHPFPFVLWILLIAALFLFSCVLFLHVYQKQRYQNILFMLFGSLLEESIKMQLRKSTLNLMLSAWLIFTFVIINSYKAVLLSILTIPPLTGIKNIPDLAKAAEQNSITCYAYKGSILQQIFLASEIETWRSIGKCMQRNKKNGEEAFNKAPSKKAFLTARTYLKPYKNKYFISDDSFYNTMHAFPVSKNCCSLNFLNERIQWLFEAGVFEKIENDEHFLLQLKAEYSDSSEPGIHNILELQDLKGAFIVLLTGYSLSIIVLFIEIVVKHYYPKSNVVFIKKRKKILKKMFKK